MKIVGAGVGYAGLSVALLLAQRNDVAIVDVVPGKVDALELGESPIRDEAKIPRAIGSIQARAFAKRLMFKSVLETRIASKGILLSVRLVRLGVFHSG